MTITAKRWVWETWAPHRQDFTEQARELGHGPIKAEAILYGEAKVVELTCLRCGGSMYFGPIGSSSSSLICNIRDQECPVP